MKILPCKRLEATETAYLGEAEAIDEAVAADQRHLTPQVGLESACEIQGIPAGMSNRRHASTAYHTEEQFVAIITAGSLLLVNIRRSIELLCKMMPFWLTFQSQRGKLSDICV